jgi:DNA replication protein DnaC
MSLVSVSAQHIIEKQILAPQFYNIIGTIINKEWKKGEKNTLLTVLSISTQKEFKIICPFFCPSRPGDAISGMCTTTADGKLIFIREPLVEPGSNEDTVKTSFIIALNGTGNFGKYRADKLYSFFESQVKQRIAMMPFDNHDMVHRNSDMLPKAVVEMISMYCFRFRSNEVTLAPLLHSGLTEEQARTLLTWWYTQFSMRRLYLLGLTWTEINDSILRGWDINELYSQLIENPYIVETVPMEKANSIAARYELIFSSELLMTAELIRFVDKQCESKGWSCYPLKLLYTTYSNLDSLLPICKKDFTCEIRFNSIYLKHQNETENILANFFEKIPINETFCSEKTKKTLCEEQITAVNNALNNNISIITGGAGTGKTTVIKSIAHEFDLRGTKFLIAAYTGKAVARIKEVFNGNIKPITLHMLINRGPNILSRIDAIIIDEISMVPNQLLARVLLKLYDYNTNENWISSTNKRFTPIQIILVGDSSQLPPIDPGNLFKELLKSPIPKTRLLVDHRRNEDSVLKTNTQQFALKAAGLLQDINFQFGGNCLFYQLKQ